MNSPLPHPLRRVYWELTAGCNLRCIHCRRTDVLVKGSPEELTTSEARSFIDQLSEMGRPVLILSGGEPLFRKDIFEIASYAQEKKLPLGIATNGTLVNERIARRLAQSGVHYASISLDGAEARTHDEFRGPGNFEKAVRGFGELQKAGIKVQINFTMTRRNAAEIGEIYELSKTMGAAALYLFLLVPVGCGVQIAESDMLSPQEVEEWLKWVALKDKSGELPIKAICAPHYYRVADEIGTVPISSERKGCLAGVSMCFISHKGDVFPCGYLPLSSGNIKTTPLQRIWEDSELFAKFRDPGLLEGRCGSCEFENVCGGCRARAYFAHGDVLAEDPACAYDGKQSAAL